MQLVDSHAHIVPSVFGDELPDVLARARQAGVQQVVCIGSGYGEGSAAEALEVAAAHPGVFATLGVHPHDATGATDELLESLAAQVAEHGVVAWGEIGLDYHYDHSPREVQRRAFGQQLDCAGAAALPVAIHTRNADTDTLDVLDRHDAWSRGVLIHCFSHTPAFAAALLERGAWLSIPGIVTFPKAADLQQAVREIPLERMLVETDSPYLAPIPHRGRRNEPAFVRDVVAFIAALKGVPAEEVAEHTTRNAREFYGLPADELLGGDPVA